jgi:DNA-binding NarL/FixJ family response regulator
VTVSATLRAAALAEGTMGKRFAPRGRPRVLNFLVAAEGEFMVSEQPGVWIDDPHPIFRRGMAACLVADGFRLAGESARLEVVPPTDVDVVVFDARDADLARTVALLAPHGAALVATVRTPTDRLLGGILDAGVAAILLHDDLTGVALVAAVRAALLGHAALPSEVLLRLFDRASAGGRHDDTGLTGRERRVLALLADGEDTRAIADDLCYSERTVKNIVHDLLTKMGCRNRAHAVAQAARQGVI